MYFPESQFFFLCIMLSLQGGRRGQARPPGEGRWLCLVLCLPPTEAGLSSGHGDTLSGWHILISELPPRTFDCTPKVF